MSGEYVRDTKKLFPFFIQHRINQHIIVLIMIIAASMPEIMNASTMSNSNINI